MNEPATQTRGFTLTRRLAATPDAVFRAWTDPVQLDWFAGATQTPEHPTSVDLRPGGAWRVWLVQPDGPQYWTGGRYLEVVPGRRLVFAWGADEGWPEFDPARPDDNPVVTVTFDEAAHGTELTVELRLAESLPEQRVQEWFRIGVRQGMSDTIDRLAPYLATIR
jgi:uncharacterized protein YndB with AHSA1/START domain